MFFPAMGSKRSEMKHFLQLRGNRQTDSHSRQMMIDHIDVGAGAVAGGCLQVAREARREILDHAYFCGIT